jgi:hypothetical protein
LTLVAYAVGCVDAIPRDDNADYWLVVADPQLTADFSYEINYGPLLPIVEYYWYVTRILKYLHLLFFFPFVSE